MKRKIKRLIPVLIPFAALLGAVLLLKDYNFALLAPKGFVALRERSVMLNVVGLMLLVAIPVFCFLFFILWKYRADRNEADYAPEHDGDMRMEFLWWVVPSVIILAISIINWRSSHELDPMRALQSEKSPLTIQVVALQWKWLFIYPDEHIATVNFVEFPEDTPVNFELTSDAAMNSFWIPELGGQMYAMAGMSTRLHLMADEAGSFSGGAAEISGAGFAGMRFAAKAVSEDEFNSWVESVQGNAPALSLKEYEKLGVPSADMPARYYSNPAYGLYNMVIAKYMAPEVKIEGAAELNTTHQ